MAASSTTDATNRWCPIRLEILKELDPDYWECRLYSTDAEGEYPEMVTKLGLFFDHDGTVQTPGVDFLNESELEFIMENPAVAVRVGWHALASNTPKTVVGGVL